MILEMVVRTVDASEIWRSPVEVGSLSHYVQGFIDWDALYFPSTVSIIRKSYDL